MGKSQSKQGILIFLCFAVYTAAYLGRYSYNSNINLIMAGYGVDHAQAGMVTTFFFVGYGVGQLINGFLCQKYNMRLIFPLVLFSSSAINLALYFGVPFGIVKFLWLLNAFLQSCLWPSIVQIISRYLDEVHRRRSIAALSCSTAVGTFLIYLISTVFAQLNFRMTFVTAAAVMSLIGVLWIILFPMIRPAQTLRQSAAPAAESDENESASRANSVVGTVVVLCLFAVIHNFIKDGLQTWVPSILKETHDLGDSLSILLSLVLPLLGTLGSIFALTLEKKIHNLVWLCVIFLGASAPLLLFVILEMKISVVLVLLAFGVTVLLMHAVNSVVTAMTPLMLKGSTNSGRLAGILNACCYVGSAASSYTLGLLADASGWNAVMILLLGAILVGTLFGTVFNLAQKRHG